MRFQEMNHMTKPKNFHQTLALALVACLALFAPVPAEAGRLAHHRRHCGADCCEPPIHLVLCVKDPCSCCEVEVPVCLPACCCGEPEMCCYPGILGRRIVDYQWECGHGVQVVFKTLGGHFVRYY
jgi:hypothetical protein